MINEGLVDWITFCDEARLSRWHVSRVSFLYLYPYSNGRADRVIRIFEPSHHHRPPVRRFLLKRKLISKSRRSCEGPILLVGHKAYDVASLEESRNWPSNVFRLDYVYIHAKARKKVVG